jgi:hypothetical protein
MQRAAALARLTASEAELRAMGVTALPLFGSVARDKAQRLLNGNKTRKYRCPTFRPGTT